MLKIKVLAGLDNHQIIVVDFPQLILHNFIPAVPFQFCLFQIFAPHSFFIEIQLHLVDGVPALNGLLLQFLHNQGQFVDGGLVNLQFLLQVEDGLPLLGEGVLHGVGLLVDPDLEGAVEVGHELLGGVLEVGGVGFESGDLGEDLCEGGDAGLEEVFGSFGRLFEGGSELFVLSNQSFQIVPPFDITVVHALEPFYPIIKI